MKFFGTIYLGLIGSSVNAATENPVVRIERIMAKFGRVLDAGIKERASDYPKLDRKLERIQRFATVMKAGYVKHYNGNCDDFELEDEDDADVR